MFQMLTFQMLLLATKRPHYSPSRHEQHIFKQWNNRHLPTDWPWAASDTEGGTQPPAYGSWFIGLLAHLKWKNFHRCSGLRHSSPALLLLLHHWTCSCDLIHWFPLATETHTSKQRGTSGALLPTPLHPPTPQHPHSSWFIFKTDWK